MMAAIVKKLGYVKLSRDKNFLSRHHRETFAKPSLSMMVVLSYKFAYTDRSVNHHMHFHFINTYIYIYIVLYLYIYIYIYGCCPKFLVPEMVVSRDTQN